MLTKLSCTCYSFIAFLFCLSIERELNLSFPLQRAFLLSNSTTDTLFIDFSATDFTPANGSVVMSPPADGPHDTTIISVFKMLSSTGIEITRKNQFGDGRAHGFTRRIVHDDGLKQATLYDKSHNLTDDAQMNSKGVENSDGLFRPIEHQYFNNFFNGESPIGATSSSSTHKTYNHKSQTTASTDARGFTTRFTYDRHDNLARTRHPDQTSTFDTTFYFGSPSALATSPLFGLNLVYQKRAYPYALPCTTWFMVKVSSDETGRKTLGIYDAGERQIRTVIDPEGLRIITDYQYDGLNRLTQITQPNGNTIDYGYDGWGNRDYERTAETGETFMKYNAFGELRFKRTARQSQFRVGAGFLGQFSFYRYDHIGRLVVEGTVNTGEGQLAQTWNSLDPNQDEWFENEATDFAVHRKLFYDRAPSTSNAANTAIGNGNSATFNWANSGISETEMTNLKGNLAAEAYREENGGWQYKYYSYDERDRVKWLRAKTHRVGTAPQVETTGYEYDAQNRPIAVHTFSSVATNGISHFYRYDARGRRSEYKVELEAELAGSQRTIAQYGYDANSNLTALKLGLNAPGDTSLRTEFVYDARNRLTGKESFNRFGTKVSECVYSYFANSNLASRAEFHLPMQGETNAWEATFRHSYDGANRLTGQWQEVSAPLDTMVLYEPIAPEVRAKHRLRLKSGFDTRTVTGTGVKFRGRISSAPYAPPLVLAAGYLAMDYDDFGRIMRLLRYDGKGRVIDSLAYQYLNNTGRLGYVRDGVGSAVSGNDVDNQLPNNYAYDASGNMTQDLGSGIGEIRYNLYNLPTMLIKSGQGYQYRYDGSGKRIEKVQPNGTIEAYRRGASGELLAIYDNTGGLKQFELDGIGEMRVEGGQWRAAYYDKDLLGNVRLIVGKDGNIIRTTDLDPWGYEYEPIRRNVTGSDTKWKFLGKEQDSESGYYDLEARKYQPTLGLFLGAEPLYGELQGVSPYSYGLNNPAKFVDKDGNAPNLLAGGIGFVSGALVGGFAYYATTPTAKYSGQDLVAAMAGGGIAGGLAGLTMGASLIAEGTVATLGTTALVTEGAMIGGVTGTIGAQAQRLLDSNPHNNFDLVASMGEFSGGIVGGGAGSGVGLVAKSIIGQAISTSLVTQSTKVLITGATEITAGTVGGTAISTPVDNSIKTLLGENEARNQQKVNQAEREKRRLTNGGRYEQNIEEIR
jgi:RHS repeat-associated protein